MAFDAETEAALIESILYLENEPVDLRTLVAASNLSREAVERALELIRAEHSSPRHGVELTEIGGAYTLSPKADYLATLQQRYGRRNEGRLSRAAMETLSIIAYSQPITKAEVESIRGVSADNMVRLLMSRDLIRVVGKRDVPGKPAEYGTTREFLRLFRLASIAELPRLDEVDREKFLDEGAGEQLGEASAEGAGGD